MPEHRIVTPVNGSIMMIVSARNPVPIRSGYKVCPTDCPFAVQDGAIIPNIYAQGADPEDWFNYTRKINETIESTM